MWLHRSIRRDPYGMVLLLWYPLYNERVDCVIPYLLKKFPLTGGNSFGGGVTYDITCGHRYGSKHTVMLSRLHLAKVLYL